MQLTNLATLTAILALIPQSLALTRMTPATKDATITRTTVSCPSCPENNCSKCTLGNEPTLKANTGGLAYSRSLVGFELPVPATRVLKCTVQFPAFTKPLQAPVNVTISGAESSDWDENTVTAENAPEAGDVLDEVEVEAHQNLRALDITDACHGADIQRRLSVYLGTRFGTIEVWGKNSGNAAILTVQYH
ncbi:hypothetical protein BDV25DRAFT_112747 [Aspergillus avenaceus]|uniref:Carbohydrate-binding module family 96 domain-containing protein n=1 Tax=Aspergillus avenaceus TaxID=36643 RepID=A0A5N6TVP8_ASPAV|nr:hypothetical protein BDV25DRAFT_112747 [Aspergillus avenaceus]